MGAQAYHQKFATIPRAGKPDPVPEARHPHASGLDAPSTPVPSARQQPVLHTVAGCIYRPESCRLDYALVKRSGKQFRRSLQTADRQLLAARRLTEFREEIRRLEPAQAGSRISNRLSRSRRRSSASVRDSAWLEPRLGTWLGSGAPVDGRPADRTRTGRRGPE